MRMAVLADLHANLAALEAVEAAIAEATPDLVLCLGDLVGYNAEPADCVARAREAGWTVVAGNHDRDVVGERPALGTSGAARQVQEWTRAQLGEGDLRYLDRLPVRVLEPELFVAVHGCYLNSTHISGYVTGTMLEENLRAVLAQGWPRLAFCGHTHVPLCGWLDDGGCTEARLVSEVIWPAKASAVLVNPGSVGQPRDGDSRASFAIVDLEARRVTLRRVAYDLERTVRAVLAAGLPASLADRLRAGR
jgi:diadenosine tetraphosphatase ApaH/serine/threonine PP2A family protein phosphatase